MSDPARSETPVVDGGAQLSGTAVLLFVFLMCVMVWQAVNITHVVNGRGLKATLFLDGIGAIQVKPQNAPPPPAQESPSTTTGKTPPPETEMMTVLVLLCGGLGAALHGVGSLVAFAGNGKFRQSWALWYLAQPLRGAILAAGFYWLVQGGLLGGLGAQQANILAMMGATFLVGLFSDAAIDKLREVFQVIFQTADATKTVVTKTRQPRIVSTKFSAGPPPQLQVEGDKLDSGDKIQIDGKDAKVLSRSANAVTIELPAGLAQGAAVRLVIAPTGQGTAPSDAYSFTLPQAT